MQKFATKQMPREVVTNTYCNKCGDELYAPHSDISSSIATVFAPWGYGSKYDGEDHLLHLCENCFDEFVTTCKIKPTITGEKGLI